MRVTVKYRVARRVTQLGMLLLGLGGMMKAEAGSIKEQTIEYQGEGKTYSGFLAMPTHGKALPGVLVIHNWMGVTDETKSKVRNLAALGYAAFAADIYGKDNRPKNVEEAGKLAMQFKTDRKMYREHLNLGLKQLASVQGVDSKKLAAIGYCFGGTGVIELARSGATVLGVASFHGGLDSPEPALGKNIKAKVIAFHGADDPWVPAKDVTAFEEEMRANKLDWQLIKYGNAVHSFTDQGAGNDPSKGAAYNANADRRSWAEMKNFLTEIFQSAH